MNLKKFNALKYATVVVLLLFCAFASRLSIAAAAQEIKPGAEKLIGFDQTVLDWANQCRDEILAQFELLLISGKASVGQVFDTFYVPIENTYPQKYHTQYDKFTDEVMQGILDKYLEKNDKLVFVVITDKNGYVPTHNTKYSQPLTGDKEKDMSSNRAKRIFNDRTGLSAAKNTDPFFLQRYSRDTGEKMVDLSVPIIIRNQHWGAVRIGYLNK
jgi:hypothetical protein